jgi:hypothetical protein
LGIFQLNRFTSLSKAIEQDKKLRLAMSRTLDAQEVSIVKPLLSCSKPPIKIAGAFQFFSVEW